MLLSTAWQAARAAGLSLLLCAVADVLSADTSKYGSKRQPSKNLGSSSLSSWRKNNVPVINAVRQNPERQTQEAYETLIGKEINCTKDEKICLSNYKLWFSMLGVEGCYQVGQAVPRLGCAVVADAALWLREGRLRGTCAARRAPCPVGKGRPVGGRRCVRLKKLAEGCRAGLARHPFGGLQCKPCGRERRLCGTRRQPFRVPGRCVFPQLSFRSVNKPSEVQNAVRVSASKNCTTNDKHECVKPVLVDDSDSPPDLN